MAIRGQRLKQGVIAAILEAFPNNCFYDENKKEMRFEGTEDGERVQIKMTFTAAKDVIDFNLNINTAIENNVENISNEVTEEEKREVEYLLNGLKGKI